MAVGYTVIQEVRQAFGDRFAEERAKELDAPFVGYAKAFPFACPDVDQSQPAVLQLESLGLTADARTGRIWGREVTYSRNRLAINQKEVPGGLTPGTTMVDGDEVVSFWKAPGEEGKNRDNFIIDNVVIFYKTKSGGDGEVPIRDPEVPIKDREI